MRQSSHRLRRQVCACKLPLFQQAVDTVERHLQADVSGFGAAHPFDADMLALLHVCAAPVCRPHYDDGRCGLYSHLNLCSGNSSDYNFTHSMQERRNSCIMAPAADAAARTRSSVMPGYWRHPGFVLQGTFTPVAYRPGVMSSSLCALECDEESAPPTSCGAFSYNPDDRLCILLVRLLARLCRWICLEHIVESVCPICLEHIVESVCPICLVHIVVSVCPMRLEHIVASVLPNPAINNLCRACLCCSLNERATRGLLPLIPSSPSPLPPLHPLLLSVPERES